MQKSLEEMKKDHRKFVESVFPVVFQPKIPTMARKCMIEAAIPGWHPVEWYEERGVKNLPPCTIEGQAQAIVECVRAGASVIHTHPRDPVTGLLTEPLIPSRRERHADVFTEIMDQAFEQVDFITCPHTWAWDFSVSREADYITHTKTLLERGKAKGVGNRYIQSALVVIMPPFAEDWPFHTQKAVQEGVAWMEANGVKPMFSTHGPLFPMLKQAVFDTGIAKWKPFWMSIQLGKHEDDQIFADPWSYIQTINTMSLVKEVLGEDALIGIHPGGRNWLPVATIGILFGCELIRVGIEDQYWLYPHRDDISQKASDTVEIVSKVVTALGREVATVSEARERLGIKAPPGT